MARVKSPGFVFVQETLVLLSHPCFAWMGHPLIVIGRGVRS